MSTHSTKRLLFPFLSLSHLFLALSLPLFALYDSVWLQGRVFYRCIMPSWKLTKWNLCVSSVTRKKTALDQISFSLVDNLILSSLDQLRFIQEKRRDGKKDKYRGEKRTWPSRGQKTLIPVNTSSKMATRQLAPSEREEGVRYNLNCPHWRSSLTR